MLDGSPLNTPDCEPFKAAAARPGAAALDAPVGDGWLLDRLGPGFTLLCWEEAPETADFGTVVLRPSDDPSGLLRQRYDLEPGTVYLFRPDRHVAARTRSPDAAWAKAALARALGK